MSLLKKISVSAGVVLTAGTMAATQAMATEGYFRNALGARSQGLSGAGVADSKDATALTLNPAGLVHAGRQFNGAISLFSPIREYSATAGAGAVVPGRQKSKRNFFPVPNVAYSLPISDTMTLGFGMSGNGGMNTTYKGGIGPFGGGNTGIDLTQLNISAGFGKQLGKYFSFGVAPIFTIQRFKAKGLAPLAGFSIRPGNLTNRGYDYSVGGGARFGVEFQLSDSIRIGGSYQTKLLMSRLKKYNGLFAERGDFDIPSNFQVGVAFDVTPDLTLMTDYRYINYSEVASIANPNPLGPLGSAIGSGFGWKDTQTFKFAAEYNATEDLTVRAGYSYNTSPIPKSQVAFNILAPATVKHHISAGATYKFSENSAVEFAGSYMPSVSITGPTGPGQLTTIKMYQMEFTVGYNYTW